MLARVARSRWKYLALVLLLIGLAVVGVLWYQYQTTKKPIQELPAVPWVPPAIAKQPPHYLLSIYGLGRPMDVAVKGGRIYVTDAGSERVIRVFDRDGNLLNTFAPPDTTALNRHPLYLALDPQGRVYVSDRIRKTIDIFSADGTYEGTFTPADIPPEEWMPLALAFDHEGNLYVTLVSPGKHQVAVFDSSGNLKLRFGREGKAEGEFWYPNGIAADDQGRIYVSDSNNGRVQVFDDQGQLLYAIRRGYAKGDLAFPRGIALDDNNRLFVVDAVRHSVNVYDVSGTPVFIHSFGAAGIGNGEFFFPNALGVDRSSRIYVTDRQNGRIQVWSY